MKAYNPQAQKQPIQMEIQQSQYQNNLDQFDIGLLFYQYQLMLNQQYNNPQYYIDQPEEKVKQEEKNVQVKTELNTIIINNSGIKKEYEDSTQADQNNLAFEPFQGPLLDSSLTQSENNNNTITPSNIINKSKKDYKQGQGINFPYLHFSNFQYANTQSHSNSLYSSQNSNLSTASKLLNISTNKLINSPPSSYRINNKCLLNSNILSKEINYAALYNQALKQQQQQQSSFQETPQNLQIKQEVKQEIIQNSTPQPLISQKQAIKQEQDCENSESNALEEKQEEKKNDPKETHNIIQQVIPLFIDRFKARCKEILNPSFQKLLERRSLTKSLQYFNQICQVIQQETEENNLPLKEIAYQIFEYDLAQWARNSKNIETACLYFKYQSAFILILKNPGVFSSIKVARKAHSKKMDKFLGKQLKDF